MIKTVDREKYKQIENNMVFVGTIYDTFEALEETMNKLGLKNAEFLLKMSKKEFAKEVFKCAKENNIYISPDKCDEKNIFMH